MPLNKKQMELNLFSLEKRRLRKDLTTVFQYAMGSNKEDGGSLFEEATWRRQGERAKVTPRVVSPQHKIYFFYSESDHSLQQPLSRDVVEIPSLEVFKVRLEKMVDNFI